MSVFKPEWVKKYLGHDPACYIHAGCFEAHHDALFKQAYPACRVIGIEANPEVYQWMLAQNRGEFVEIVHAALCAHDGEVPFRTTQSIYGEAGNGSILEPSLALTAYNQRLVFAPPRLVLAVTLEKYCVHRGITEIDAVHLDLQGAEMLALTGFGQIRPKLLYVEHGEIRHYQGASSKESLAIALKRMGYRKLEGDGWAALYQYDQTIAEPLLLSILIPSIPSRFAKAQALVAKLEAQIGTLPIEVLVFTDNKKRSIGEKREALVQMAQAKMVAFQDDDDDVAPDYCAELIAAIRAHPDVDVVVFQQQCTLDGKQPFVVHFGLEYENEQVSFGDGVMRSANKAADIHRKPWTCCAWRRTLAQQHHFPNSGLDEDWNFIQQLLPYAKTQARVDKILNHYQYNSQTSEGDQTIATRKAGA